MSLMSSPSTLRPRFVVALLLGTAFLTCTQTGALAETLTVRDVATSGAELYQLSIPTVEVIDGNLTETEIRQLFQLDSVDDLTKWAGITAASLKIPEVKLTYSVPATGSSPAMDETVTYRDIELRDVQNGIAGSTLIGESTVESSQGGLSMTFGEMSTGRFDMGAMLGFYGIGGAAAASSEMQEIYDDFRFTGGKFSVAGALECSFGAATAGKFLARPLRTSLTDFEAVILRVQEAETNKTEPSPDDVKLLVGYYTDLLTAFSSEPMQFDGFDCSGTDPTSDKPFAVSSGEIRVGDFQPGIYPAISLDDFNVDAGSDGYFRFGNFTWKRMDLNGPIEVLEGADLLDPAWFTANWRKLVPVMDGMSFADVDFDLPDPSTPGQRSKGTAGLFDIDLANYVNGLPSSIALALDDATLPLPAELGAGPAAAQIAVRGITEITSDTHVKLHWDEAQQAIIVDEILSDSDDFFRVAIKGTIGNATSDLFSENDDQALAAGLALTVKDLTIDLEDRGLYGLMLEVGAAESKQPLTATRTAVSGMAQGMTLAILGSDETSLAAVGEMGKFLSGANSKLSVTLTAKDGAGLTLTDLAALEKDPTVLAGKVTVTAIASGEPVPMVEVAPAPEAAPDASPDAAPEAPRSPAEEGASLQQQKRDLKAPAQQ